MNIDEVVQLLSASQQKSLTPLQDFVLRSAWEGKTFVEMASTAHYGEEHIRKTASFLWQSLTQCCGIKVTKASFRKTLESLALTRSQTQLIENYYRQQTQGTLSEFPSGPVPVNSRFYIPRPPIEDLAFTELTEPGSVIRIKGARRMGKSSLLLRILHQAQNLGYRSAMIDFQQAEQSIFENLNRFVRWFCVNVSRQLQIRSRLDEVWDAEIGIKVSCTLYFEAYLLEELNGPLVLALNEVNRLFEYPQIAQDFLPLLRFWHEQAKQSEIWQKVRIIVAYSTDIHIPLTLTQSPLNVGLPLKLPSFNPEQVQALANCYAIHFLDSSKIKRLTSLVGGHPYLIRLALYHLSRQEITIEQMFEQVTTELGIYSEHLRQYLAILQEQPQLSAAFKQVVQSREGVKIDPLLAYRLESMGLVRLDQDLAFPSCILYRLYFQNRLP